jgi:RNA polymerase sigma-70 factor (ECF subfamily)
MTVIQPDFARALKGAQTGDNDAFSDLWRITNPILLRYLRITAPELADDVASATWVKVARGLRSVSGDQRTFHTLLVRIARDEAAVRRRNSRRRPDTIIDMVQLESARAAAASGAQGPLGDALTSEEVVPLVSRLRADVAEMVALRAVVGLTAAETAAVMGMRRGSVIVAVHSGLRRTSNLVAQADDPTGRPNPWELDRLLDLGELGLSELDPSMRTVVSALSAPSVPGDLAQLAAAHFAFERSLHRTFAFAPALLLPFLLRRLDVVKGFFSGKIAVVALGTAVLSAPAAVAYSDPIQAPAPAQQVVAAAGEQAQTLRLPIAGPVVDGTPARPAAAARSPQPVVKHVAKAKPARAKTSAKTTRHAPVAKPAHHRAVQRPVHKAQKPVATRQRRHHNRAWWWLYLQHHR